MEEGKQLRQSTGRAVGLAILLGLLTACGGSSSQSSSPPPPPPATISSVTVTSNQANVPVGETSRFRCDGEGYGSVQYVGSLGP
jgi:hypothetical protein